jgi:excisionase family DNA binding protein
MAKQYLDIRQEAQRINVSVPHLERLVAKGGYPSIKIGKLRRFDPDRSDEYLATLASVTSTNVAKAA